MTNCLFKLAADLQSFSESPHDQKRFLNRTLLSLVGLGSSVCWVVGWFLALLVPVVFRCRQNSFHLQQDVGQNTNEQIPNYRTSLLLALLGCVVGLLD